MPGSVRFAIPKVFPIVAGAALLTAALVSIGGSPALAASSATINGAQTFQTITGFGASEGFGQAETIMGASSSVEQQALNYLFSPTSGAGLTILRNEISADSGDTIEPNAPSSPTATPTYLPLSSINNDQDQLTLAQAIKADYGVTNVFADAWSAPGFMKTNDSAVNGGTPCGLTGATCSSGNWVQAYANYLVQYAKDYAAAGVPLSYVGPENESGIGLGGSGGSTPPSYDGMEITPAQTAQLLDTLGPTVAASGLSTQMECCASEGWDQAQSYAAAIESNPTALADTAAFTSHGYTEAPTTPLSGWTKAVWETEWSTFQSWDPAWDDGSTASGLTWAQNIFAGLDQANLNAFLYWWGSSTPSGNGDNESLIQINGSTVTPSGRLWAFAGWSDYVRPGAVRIGATTSDGNLTLDAFKNTNGTIAVVALNTGSSSDTVNFALSGTGVANGATVKSWLTNSSNSNALQASTTVSGGSFTSTLPARSLVTFTMPSGTVTNTVTVTNPGSQTGKVGTAITPLQIQASDSASGQTLSYSSSTLPAGLSINSSTGVISGTPTASGTSTVTVTATDTTGASGSTSFSWVISPNGTNTVTVTNPGAQNGTVGTAVSLQIKATDSASGQTLTYSAAQLPAGLSMNSSTGLISGTPTTAGTSSVTVTATDTTGASGSAAFTWTIATGSPPGACKVVYTNNSQWPGGWSSQVVITNTGTSTINGWSLVFTFGGDQKVTQNYNGGYSQSGETATLTNASYNGTIAPNASITDGFQGTWTNSNAAPTSFTLNGATCTT